ncbi:hypothetical protein K439DRAFT_1403931 [Ramaria rubella]|nr:hypothetical protein K439DRAFT_1403931 [Ramaria rubella]
MTSSSPSAPAPSPALVSFARGTIATLKLWPALRFAVEGSWGGPESAQKQTWLASSVVDAFEEATNKNEAIPDAIYVEEMLLQVLADEFDVVIEDGSAQPVAAAIVKLWQETMHDGTIEGVTMAEALVEQLRGTKIVVDEKDASDEEYQWDDDEDGSDSETEEVPQLMEQPPDKSRAEPKVDEDGFTMVKGRGKGHR